MSISQVSASRGRWCIFLCFSMEMDILEKKILKLIYFVNHDHPSSSVLKTEGRGSSGQMYITMVKIAQNQILKYSKPE